MQSNAINKFNRTWFATSTSSMYRQLLLIHLTNKPIPSKLRRADRHKKNEATKWWPLKSGYQDLNLGPPVPKTGALPGCATSRTKIFTGRSLSRSTAGLHPELLIFTKALLRNALRSACGEGGIRTLVTPFGVRRFSKPLVSATHPPHRIPPYSV